MRTPQASSTALAMAAAVGLPALFRFLPAATEAASEAAAIDADVLTALLARAAEVEHLRRDREPVGQRHPLQPAHAAPASVFDEVTNG
mgnify:CR=1 FL=1